LEEVLQHENFIVDRSEESDDKVSAKLVRLMQFGITSEKSGEQSAAEVADSLLPAREPRPVRSGSKSDEVFVEDVESDEDSEEEIEENTRATMIFQPDMVTATHPLGPAEAAQAPTPYAIGCALQPMRQTIDMRCKHHITQCMSVCQAHV
jgi:hypothetical protein